MIRTRAWEDDRAQRDVPATGEAPAKLSKRAHRALCLMGRDSSPDQGSLWGFHVTPPYPVSSPRLPGAPGRVRPRCGTGSGRPCRALRGGGERQGFAGASGRPTWFQPPAGPDSPFTLLPVTRHFMLPPVTGMGQAAGSGANPSSTVPSGSLPLL